MSKQIVLEALSEPEAGIMKLNEHIESLLLCNEGELRDKRKIHLFLLGKLKNVSRN